MDLEKKEQLIAAKIDVDGVLERFMGNEKLLEKMLKKFSDDDNYQKLFAAVEKKDAEAALAAAHTLKGICGNLSMNTLFPLFARQVELFRSGEPEAAFAMMPEISEAYENIVGIICKL